MATTAAKYGLNYLMGRKKKQQPQQKGHKGRSPRGPTDPYYEEVKLRNAQTGKRDKVLMKRTIPEWIPEHDRAILKEAQASAYKWDMGAFTIAGLSFGWESVIGLIPE